MGIRKYELNKPVSIAPLITFRITFGLLMFFSMVRFWWRGWVTSVYVLPSYHFTYLGFDWVKPLNAAGMHTLFGLIVISTLLITFGLFYRIAIAFFFLAFTYVELLDVTTYLNHYYFISLAAFIMIWLPAGNYYSLDVVHKPDSKRSMVPAWTIDIIRFQLAMVYVFAGLAKLNTDWILSAEPMKTWLPGKSHLPLIGFLMYKSWVAYLFSWFGAAYDLLIVFFLLDKRSRKIAYCFVLIFHISTAIFFPGIGMFPYVMIVSSLIYFSGGFHTKLLSRLPWYGRNNEDIVNPRDAYKFTYQRMMTITAGIFILIQIFIPLRFLLYPGHLFWTEQGYRFSWRVMLMEKSGAAYFVVKDPATHQITTVNNAAFLTPIQEKMMSTQPDLILQYAHHLANEYKQRGMLHPEVYAEVYVSLNGQRSALFLDTTVNLATQPVSFKNYNWILPYKKEDK